jgi:hypothetical protein
VDREAASDYGAQAARATDDEEGRGGWMRAAGGVFL